MGCSEPSLELSDLGQIRVERVSNIWKTARGAFDLSHARSQFLECRAKEFHCVVNAGRNTAEPEVHIGVNGSKDQHVCRAVGLVPRFFLD